MENIRKKNQTETHNTVEVTLENWNKWKTESQNSKNVSQTTEEL
jgi:hypothetical protein